MPVATLGPAPAKAAGPRGARGSTAATTQHRGPRLPSDASDFSYLDDPAFLDERARVRRQLEHVPQNAVGRRELERVYEAMTVEFCRRARIAWAAATEETRRLRLLGCER
jgi:hypothetical protein